MINEATVQRTRFHPELLPDARIVSASAGYEVSPPILDLRRFGPKVLYLTGLSVEQSANAEVRLRNDDRQRKVSCAGLPDRKALPWFLTASNSLYYNLYAVNAISNFRTTYGVWVMRPTVAHKLAMGKQLSQAEEQLAQSLNIRESVDKGILPLPISYMIEREYRVVDEAVHVLTADLSPGVYATTTISPRRGEFLVLTGIAASPGVPEDGIKIRIDRDIDIDYLELDAYALSLDEPLSDFMPTSLTNDLPCWVPALYELRLKVTATRPVSGHITRITVKHCQMTDLLRVRFGLPTRAETPASLVDRVRGGVL